MSDGQPRGPMGEIVAAARSDIGAAQSLRAAAQEFSGSDEFDWHANSHLTLTRMNLSRIIYYDMLYREIVGVPGVICEFGVQWGATLALLSNLRGMYEPYNVNRRIVGFDTFTGFPEVDSKDGDLARVGDYSTSVGHAERLRQLLRLHESLSPVAHMERFELVEGDVTLTTTQWLESNPETIIAMAIFDLDIYLPTKAALEAVLPRLTKGSVLVFDELNTPAFPGETMAMREVLGTSGIRLRQFPHQSRCAWAVWGD